MALVCCCATVAGQGAWHNVNRGRVRSKAGVEGCGCGWRVGVWGVWGRAHRHSFSSLVLANWDLMKEQKVFQNSGRAASATWKRKKKKEQLIVVRFPPFLFPALCLAWYYFHLASFLPIAMRAPCKLVIMRAAGWHRRWVAMCMFLLVMKAGCVDMQPGSADHEREANAKAGDSSEVGRLCQSLGLFPVPVSSIPCVLGDGAPHIVLIDAPLAVVFSLFGLQARVHAPRVEGRHQSQSKPKPSLDSSPPPVDVGLAAPAAPADVVEAAPAARSDSDLDLDLNDDDDDDEGIRYANTPFDIIHLSAQPRPCKSKPRHAAHAALPPLLPANEPE